MLELGTPVVRSRTTSTKSVDESIPYGVPIWAVPGQPGFVPVVLPGEYVVKPAAEKLPTDSGDNKSIDKDKSCCSKQLCNIILLGLGFMFSMGAFFTCMFSQTVILNSVHDEYFQGTPTMGYVCLAINFAAMTISFALSPALSAVIGPKISMVIGSVFLMLSVGVFLRPLEYTLYIGALSQGIGAGIMWTVYGHFLTANSTDKTIGRNTGIFWVLFQSGPVGGNLFYFFLTNGASHISDTMRYTLYSVLLPASGMGVLTLCLLRHPWVHDALTVETADHALPEKQTERVTFGQALRAEMKMALSKEMVLLAPMFIYMGNTPQGSRCSLTVLFLVLMFVGIELTFWMNVYGTSLGYTLRFGTIRESLVGLNGMFIGFGQIFGGVVYGFMGGCLRRHGRDLGILLAFLVHLVAFYAAYLVLPERSALEMTSGSAYVPPVASPYIALTCSFLLGFGDAGWNNPLFALFGSLYPNDPVAAFAIFQAYQSFGNVISFAYSTVLTVPYQLLIMVVTAVIGLFGYCLVEWKVTSDETAAEIAKRKLAENALCHPIPPAIIFSPVETRIINGVLATTL